MRRWLPIALLLMAGCSPTIGDRCGTSLNCSINGTRTCDTSVLNGQCTIFGCDPNTCPDGAVCVRWYAEPARLSFTACMRHCAVDGNCRYDDGFRCVNADALGSGMFDGPPVAVQITDTNRPADDHFCVGTMPPPP